MWSTRAGQLARSSGRHWKIAECSLSIGSSVAPPACHRIDEERTADDQRFLVGEQQALAGFGGGQARGQARGADDRRHDDVDLRVRGQVAERRPRRSSTSVPSPASASRARQRRSAFARWPSRRSAAACAGKGRTARRRAFAPSVRRLRSDRGGATMTSSVAMPTEPVAPKMQTRCRAAGAGAALMPRRAPWRSEIPGAARRRDRECRRARAAGHCCPSRRHCA